MALSEQSEGGIAPQRPQGWDYEWTASRFPATEPITPSPIGDIEPVVAKADLDTPDVGAATLRAVDWGS